LNNQENDIFVETRGQLGSFALDVAFHAPLRGVTALFGPSGCGKTSVLRAIAGLNRLAGSIRIGQDIWQQDKFFLPTHSRAIGYVFQEASLFPHLSVHANLTFGMEKDKGNQTEAFDEIISLLGLGHLVRRYPHHLSGGERQRVAIGRALLSSPKVLLMDEPLSALDHNMREEIMPFLLRLRAHLAIPIFYITHDMREVERLADYLVLMQSGSVMAAGPLQKLQAETSLPLARESQAAVSLDAHLNHWDEESGLATFSVANIPFRTPLPACPPHSHIRLKIAASDVSLTREEPTASSILNILPVRILSATPLEGNEMLVALRLIPQEVDIKGRDEWLEDLVILSRLSRFSWQRLQLSQGQQLYAQIKGVSILPKYDKIYE